MDTKQWINVTLKHSRTSEVMGIKVWASGFNDAYDVAERLLSKEWVPQSAGPIRMKELDPKKFQSYYIFKSKWII